MGKERERPHDIVHGQQPNRRPDFRSRLLIFISIQRPRRFTSLPRAYKLVPGFIRVGAVDVLVGAGLLCRSWLEAAKLPDVWRVVDMEMQNNMVLLLKDDAVLRAMAKVVIDRSDGQLRVFAGKLFVNDEIMEFLVKRSPSLTTLRLVSCPEVFNTRFISVMKESPLLELRSLELDGTDVRVGELTSVLESCPVLEVLRVQNCFNIDRNEDLVALEAKFPRIKTMMVECDEGWDGNCDFDYYDYESYGSSEIDCAPYSEDERTDCSM